MRGQSKAVQIYEIAIIVKTIVVLNAIFVFPSRDIIKSGLFLFIAILLCFSFCDRDERLAPIELKLMEFQIIRHYFESGGSLMFKKLVFCPVVGEI